MAENNEQDTGFEQGSSSSSPHEALFFVLAYLPMFELLTTTQVCKSLRDAVNNNILPWINIIVNRPLNSRLTDDVLMEVVSKAKGRLQLLGLINCLKITDDGLLRVVSQNPRITKIHVPGCTNLSPEGVIKAATLLTQNNHKLESLKINGIYNIQKQDLETLHNLIDQNPKNQKQYTKILYHEHKKNPTHKHNKTNHPIDIDICPKCDQVRMVFDCPRILCEEKKQQRQDSECRGCESCISRCIECGICLSGTEELEEACCADMLCLDCWLKLPKCSFCNKPYCNQHVDQQHRVSGSTGFVCDACHVNYN